MEGREVVEKLVSLHKVLEAGNLSSLEVREVEQEMRTLSAAIVYAACHQHTLPPTQEFPNLIAQSALFSSIRSFAPKFGATVPKVGVTA